MAGLGCYCGGNAPNTGVGKCPSIIAKTNSIGMTPLRNNDGDLNYIDLSGGTGIDLVALAQNADASKRFYPIQNLENVTIVKTDAVMRPFNGGNEQKVRDGVYQFECILGQDGISAPEIGNIKAMECGDWAFYGVTISGSLYGTISEDGTKLYPIQIKGFSADGTFASDEAKADGMIKFNIDDEFSYGDLWQLTKDVFTLSPLMVEGLVNVTLKESVTATATGVTLTATDQFRNNFATPNITGLLASDFIMTNNVTGTAVVITSVTESPTANYAFIYPSTTDEFTIEIDPTSGYAGSIILEA